MPVGEALASAVTATVAFGSVADPSVAIKLNGSAIKRARNTFEIYIINGESYNEVQHP